MEPGGTLKALLCLWIRAATHRRHSGGVVLSWLNYSELQRVRRLLLVVAGQLRGVGIAAPQLGGSGL